MNKRVKYSEEWSESSISSKRVKHFEEWFKDTIEERYNPIVVELANECIKNKCTNGKEIMSYLKETNRTKYLGYLGAITEIVRNKKMNINKLIEHKDEILYYFNQISLEFDKKYRIIDQMNKSFIPYNYCIFYICEIINQDFDSMIKGSREQLWDQMFYSLKVSEQVPHNEVFKLKNSI